MKRIKSTSLKKWLLLFISLNYYTFASACNLSFTGSTINFGNYNPLSGSAATGTLNFISNCSDASSSAARTISISQGQQGTISDRQLFFNSHTLSYALYTDASYTVLWGDGSSGTSTLTVPQTDNNSVTIYAKISASQNAFSGVGTNYADMVTIVLGNPTTQTQPLSIQASVPNVCTIAVVTNLEFGAYNSASDSYATGALNLKCSTGASAVSVTLDDGLNALPGLRRMADGSGHYVQYEVYQPNGTTPGASCAYATRWGTSGPEIFNLSANPPSFSGGSYNVCGRIQSGQSIPPPGSYSDTIQASINY